MDIEINPETFEVLKNTQIHIVREMGLVMQRASFSVVFSEGLDFSCALYDEKGQMLAQAENIPAHLGCQRLLTQNSLKEIGTENIEKGDILLSNDSYFGGSHFPDLTLMKPIFYKDEFIAVSATLAHHTDVGGMVPGSFASAATETFQEALQIPPVKIVQKGEINNDVLNIIRRNVRLPEEVTADIKAQIASINTGEKRLIRLIDKYGIETWKYFREELLNYSENRMRDGISTIPEGEYEFEDYMDNDGVTLRPYKIAVKTIVKKDKIICDFGKSDSQARGPINCPYAMTMSAVVAVVKSIADPHSSANEGMFRPIEIITPKGSIVNPIRPAPTTGGLGETSNRVAGVIWGSLAKAVPERSIACQGCSDNNLFISGIDPETNNLYILYDYPEVGWGARPFADGVNAIYALHTGNVDNNLAEVYEHRWPVLVKQYSLRDGKGGEGKYRGGVGIIKEYTTWPPHKTTLSTMADRTKFGAYGLKGGKTGATGKWSIITKDGKIKPMSKHGGKVTKLKLKSGDTLKLETPSGGGYGNPLERDPEEILKDVKNDFFNIEYAKDKYSVVIDSHTFTIKKKETESIRNKLKSNKV